MDPMTILFLDGWQSTPGGLKSTYLAQHGHEVLNPALPDDDFDAAVEIVQGEFDRQKPDVVVGSSSGGAVAMNIDSGTRPLVLLCPAWKRWGTATTVKPNTAPIAVKSMDIGSHGIRIRRLHLHVIRLQLPQLHQQANACQQRGPTIRRGQGGPDSIEAEEKGQNQCRWDQEQHLPGQHQQHGLLGLANRLKVTCTDDLKADQRQH